MTDKIYVSEFYDRNNEWQSQISLDEPNSIPELQTINIYEKGKTPKQIKIDELSNPIGTIDLNLDLSKEYIIELMPVDEDEIYKKELLKWINNYLDHCMIGRRARFKTNTDLTEQVKLDWITDQTSEGITNNYLGVFQPATNTIFVERPDLKTNPVILLHEILHSLTLEHTDAIDQNIMGDDFLTTNYKISTAQIAKINGHEVDRTINETVLPLNECLVKRIES